MKNYEFRCTKKCPINVFISEFIYEFMKNHELIYKFIKKRYAFGCTKNCPLKEFLYIISYMNSYAHMRIQK